MYYMSTWPPAEEPGKLYTFHVSMLYLGIKHWRNAITHSVHKWFKGISIEKKYSKDYSMEDKDCADETVCKYIRFGSNYNDFAVLFLDTQAWLYLSLVEVQRILIRFGFIPAVTLLGGEVILYKKGQVIFPLVGHPSVAGDARDADKPRIPLDKAQRRGVALTALKNWIEYLNRDSEPPITVNGIPPEFDDQALWSTTVGEQLINGLHGPNLFRALVHRDALLLNKSPEESALTNTGVSLSPPDDFFHWAKLNADKARRSSVDGYVFLLICLIIIFVLLHHSHYFTIFIQSIKTD